MPPQNPIKAVSAAYEADISIKIGEVCRDSMAHHSLGCAAQMRGDSDGAIAHYQKALQLDPGMQAARRNLAKLLVSLGRRQESFYLWHAELLAGGLEWIDRLISDALRSADLGLVGEYASILAELRHGSAWCPRQENGSVLPLPVQAAPVFITIPKLRHDIQQFEYLQRQGVLGDEFTPIIKDYQRVIDRLTRQGIKERVPLTSEDQWDIGHVFNRIVHVRHTPRVARALSGQWEGKAVENHYLDHPLGLVVVDNLLSPEALEGVRLFCLASTVWSSNRYAYGRLGAFLRDGFNCPLLFQIAEELAEALPRVINQYPLRQLWGFKNCDDLPGDSTNHADFAAVNVNFWITPDEANLDDKSGGMFIYDIDAPLSWDFEKYNRRSDLIKLFLRQQDARPVEIPYRQNRAVIFNSDLFHGTAALRFRPDYEYRRVNITMLFGDRVNDLHHRQLAHQDPTGAPHIGSGAWRSAAFNGARGTER